MYLLSAPRKLNSLMTPPTSDDSKIGSIIKGQMGYALSKKYIMHRFGGLNVENGF